MNMENTMKRKEIAEKAALANKQTADYELDGSVNEDMEY